MITPTSTSPAPTHRSKEKLPKHDGAFGCAGSVGDGGAVAVSSLYADGLGVGVAGADSLVAFGVDVAVFVPVVVLVGVSVDSSANGVSVPRVTVDCSVRVAVTFNVAAIFVAVAVGRGGRGVLVGIGPVVGGVVGREVGFFVGGGLVGGGSVGCTDGVRVGIVWRKGFCPDAAHNSGLATVPIITIATSVSTSIRMVCFIMPPLFPFYHNRRGRPGRVILLIG
jgi:hypothetical protein